MHVVVIDSNSEEDPKEGIFIEELDETLDANVEEDAHHDMEEALA